MKTIKLIVILFFISLLTACSEQPPGQPDSRPEMLVYCGITMVNPVKEIATVMEKELGVKIIITQGGSEDLYQSLKRAQKGDLYLPGSASYRKKHLDEGLLGEFVPVGYNQAAVFVAKNNPHAVSADLNELLRDDLHLILGDPGSGSIGNETKKILTRAGIFEQAIAHATFLSTDSRSLNTALIDRSADITINWRATAFFPFNRDHITVIDLAPEVATPKQLQLNLLTFSKLPEQSKKFMAFAASEAGQAIFQKHGFLNNHLRNIDAL